MSKFFINRPIVAIVISIIVVIVGAVTIVTLPVAQFPNIVPPEVQVLATYVGADAQTIEQSVAAAKREATRHLAARSVEIVKPQERSMRKVYVGAAIAAALLLVVAFLRPPVTATASMARLRADTVDVYKLHSTIDAKALPTQQVDSLF